MGLTLYVGECARLHPKTVAPPPTPQQAVDAITSEETRYVQPTPRRVSTQPTVQTLINFPTAVYTSSANFTTRIAVLGFPVQVMAKPTSYTWSFGDGTTFTTTSAGHPYPQPDVTHKYQRLGDVRVSVTVHYAASVNVANTGWQQLPGTLDITGPATALHVSEIMPQLTNGEPGG